MSFHILYHKTAVKQIEKLRAAKLLDTARKLIAIIKEDPFQNPPAYEKLKGNLDGKYSRRINLQHRLVYSVDESINESTGEKEKTIKILSMWSHYEE